jgi:hypothetical protein
MRIQSLMTLWAACAACVGSMAAVKEPATSPGEIIRWQLANPYPLLRNEATVRTLRDSRGASPTDFYAQLASEWEPGKYIVTNVEETMFDRSSGTYDAKYVLAHDDLVEILLEYHGAAPASQTCVWQVEGSNAEAEIDCAIQARLSVPLGVKTKVLVRHKGGTQSYSTHVQPVQEITVALGDSYSSGEGNPDIPAVYSEDLHLKDRDRPGADWIFKTNFCSPEKPCRSPAAVWWDRECHRSLLSWPVLSTLWRAIDPARNKVRHVLLDFACSGAELVDGVFYAQEKNPIHARSMNAYRDGQPRSGGEQSEILVPTTTRSQVNATFDVLCKGQPRHSNLVRVASATPVQAWVDTCNSPLTIDHLFLSIGGNDLKFGSIAMGTLVPIEPNPGLLHAPALWVARKFMGAASPSDARKAAANFRPHYLNTLNSVSTTLNVTPDRTIVVKYPNPIVTNKLAQRTDAQGCINGARLNGEKGTVRTQEVRVRDMHLVLGQVLNEMTSGVISGWTVRASQNEVENFGAIFSDINEMQTNPKGMNVISPQAYKFVEFGLESDFVNGQRLCDMMEMPTAMDLPFYFCAHNVPGSPHTCDFETEIGGNWRARDPRSWLHYTKLDKATPRKYVVYSMNEAVMANRGWVNAKPNNYEITEALSGSMHPSAQAHAAAATEVAKALAD